MSFLLLGKSEEGFLFRVGVSMVFGFRISFWDLI